MFALIIGVLVGTYSSVFIATPIMFDSYKKGD
jgi:SecD/SecF fusion protein